MTARDALREGARILGAGRDGSETPFLDASLLLAAALGVGRDRLLASGPDEVPPEAAAAYEAMLARRAAGEPVAYVLGRKEFFGRPFRVDSRVLIPRPDTELLVEAALAAGDRLERELATGGEGGGGRPLRVHEPCVGSGCVAVTLALERPRWAVSASDLSPEALAVASANAAELLPAERPGGPLGLFASDLLAAAPGPYDLVVANPPYVRSEETDRLLARGWGEPRLALDGGGDGLDPYRRLLPEAAARLAPGGFLLLEAGEEQGAALRALFEAAGFEGVRTLDDLAGLPRATEGRLPWKR